MNEMGRHIKGYFSYKMVFKDIKHQSIKIFNNNKQIFLFDTLFYFIFYSPLIPV